MKVFEVYHVYDVDGGFGDAIGTEELVAVFENFNDANDFMEKFRNPHVYESPYSDLTCGDLRIRECKVISHKEFDINSFDPVTEHYWWTNKYDRMRAERSLAYDHRAIFETPVDEYGRITKDLYIDCGDYDAGTSRDEILCEFNHNCEELGFTTDGISKIANKLFNPSTNAAV